ISIHKRATSNTPAASHQTNTIYAYFKYLGKKYVYTMIPLKGGEWVLVLQQEVQDAFSKLYTARYIGIAVFVFAVVGIIIIALVVARKITKYLAEVGAAKEKMHERVRETNKLASLGELAAGIAHEINNPVAIMVEEAGWIGDLLSEEEFQETENLTEFKRALAQIKQQGARCKDITLKLLSFARRTDPRMVNVQMNAIVEETVKLTRQSFKFRRVEIKANMQPELPTVSASATEVQQVLLNLINNAVDSIDVSKDDGLVDIITKNDNDHITITVCDNGQGIPNANLDKIFEPFFTTKPVGKGTGLGLSICYGIIKKMGGDITVKSEIGQGTCFVITLPQSD
ncbi:MAG: ATP-binding protein, partial [Candidatus Magnetoovum sp. WYHC-5]|nr:ATP-binding protein [Candidatus Magnetoovum sp. WYHC-5]